MRRMVAAALACAVFFSHGQTLSPGDYRNFYVPNNWKNPTVTGHAYYVNGTKLVKVSYTLAPSEDGTYKSSFVSSGVQSNVSAWWTAIEAATLAASAMAEALYAQKSVDTMAKKIYDLLTVTGITIEDAKGNKMTVKSKDLFNVGRSAQKAKGGLIEAATDRDLSETRVGRGLTRVNDEIGLSMWGTESNADTLANVLSGKGPKEYETRDVLCRSSANGELKYLKIGSGLGGGASNKVDGATISRNADGELELRNWSSGNDPGEHKASDCVIPYATSAAGLEWGRFLGFFNDKLFDWDTKENTVMLENWSENMGTLHYFGTGDTAGEFGFHELPNVSTNRVEGDGLTIDSTTEGEDGEAGSDVKKLGLLGWPPPGDAGLPYAIGQGEGGQLVYMPLPEQLTNGNVFAFDDISLSSNSQNQVEIKGWSDAGSSQAGRTLAERMTSPDEGASSGESEGTYEVVARVGGAGGRLAYVEVGDSISQPDDDQFVVDGSTGKFKINSQDGKFLRGTADNGIEWVDMAGNTVVDNISISTNETRAMQIKGFASAQACGAPLSDMLTDPNGAEAKSHLFLAKKTGGGGELHYVEIGKGIASGQVDDASIKTNSLGKLEIAGFKANGVNGTFPRSNGSGIEWVNPSTAIKIVGTDASEAVVGSGGTTNTLTFAYQNDSSNVVVTVSRDGNGNAIVRIGAYWR